jgi:hypothetical protein
MRPEAHRCSPRPPAGATTTWRGRLRIELRTPDPDVRIIWFGEREGVAADK